MWYTGVSGVFRYFGPSSSGMIRRAPEADDLAGQVADRPHDPAPETVVGSTVAAQREPGGDHFVIREARGAQALDQVVPAWQREPHCEHVSGLGIQVTLREELLAGCACGEDGASRKNFAAAVFASIRRVR